MRHRSLTAATALTSCLLALLAAGPSTAQPRTDTTAADPAARDDFNGDGYRDLVIGSPDATVNGHAAAGSVVVTYGTASGIDATRRTVLTQNTSGFPGAAEAGDRFGAAVASADLDSDGYADLVVGSPGEDLAVPSDQGSVGVIWGSPNGLSGGVAILEASRTPGARFGLALAVGNFTAEHGTQELAVLTGDRLYVHAGFTRTGPATQTEVTAADGGPVFAGATVTSASSGEVGGNIHDDLVVFGTSGTSPYTGYFSGATDGLTFQRDLAAGTVGDIGRDINDDGFNDLVVGRPDANQGAGEVEIMYGDTYGPSKGGPENTLTQAGLGIGTNEPGDHFGAAISVDDVDWDGFGDIAVGAPGEDVGSSADAGSVVLVKGALYPGPYTATMYHQGTTNIPGAVEAGDRFGEAVHLYNPNGDFYYDLAVTAPGENADDGALWVLPGTDDGLVTAGTKSFDPAHFGVTSSGGRFGSVLPY